MIFQTFFGTEGSTHRPTPPTNRTRLKIGNKATKSKRSTGWPFQSVGDRQ